MTSPTSPPVVETAETTTTTATTTTHHQHVLSRELRDEFELFFERWRNRGLFDFDDSDLTLEEEFLMLISRFPGEALSEAVLMTAIETPNSTFSGRLPIHLACDNHAPIGVIRCLLDSDTEKTTILRPDKWGDLPIHTACSRSDFLEVIKLLLLYDVHKQTILVKDENGSLPLHMACRYNAGKEVIQLLLENDIKRISLFEKGVYGQLPIHVACRGGASTDAIQILLDFDENKTSVLKEDNVGRLAIHLYLLTNRNTRRDMDTVKILLEAMICNRLERVGLELWRKSMTCLFESLTKSYERDFVTRDRLDAIVNEIKELMKRSFLLELAIWKATCLRSLDGDGIAFQSVQDIPCQHKQDCHIKSGAEIIIPHVLPFLEDESITKLMKELD